VTVDLAKVGPCPTCGVPVRRMAGVPIAGSGLDLVFADKAHCRVCLKKKVIAALVDAGVWTREYGWYALEAFVFSQMGAGAQSGDQAATPDEPCLPHDGQESGAIDADPAADAPDPSSHPYTPDGECTGTPEVGQNRLGHWRQGQPDTARLAALDNYVRSGTQRANVLHALVLAGEHGATDYELWVATNEGPNRCLRPHVAGTRRKELCDEGLARSTPAYRPTDSGSDAVVWEVTELGVAMHERVMAGAKQS
jgi:hypothetical protein